MENLEEPLLEEDNSEKGGFRALPFIIGIEAFEKMATYGVMPNMTLYLMKEYNMEMATASNILFLWSSFTNFMQLFGAIVSDSFLGRFHTIGLGSIVSLTGLILLWSTTIIQQARPPPCDQSSMNCSPTIFHFVYLCTSFGLISIGAGGIRSSSLAFGADQLQKGDFKSVDKSYFSWYYASYIISVVIALTCVVYIQDNLGWQVGFGVPVMFMLFGAISFFLASPFYVKLKTKTCLVTDFARVVVASYKNRHLEVSDDDSSYVCHSKKGSSLVSPTKTLRLMNKACIVRDPLADLTPDGTPKDKWSLCTVDQVEELKALIQIVPVWSTGMIMSINISQNSFPLLQAFSMNRRITPSFEIPAASFSTFVVISVILWIAIYDRVFLPLASKVKGRQVRINTLTRMGIGIFLSFLAMIVSGIIEGIRRSLAINEGFVDLSAMWLIPQNCLTGFAEASNAIAQNEFYFSELPRSMSSIASSLNGIGMSLANLLASLIMNIVDSISKAGGRESWISSNINKGHYDYYYLVLAGISVVNMIYFLLCCRAYGASKQGIT